MRGKRRSLITSEKKRMERGMRNLLEKKPLDPEINAHGKQLFRVKFPKIDLTTRQGRNEAIPVFYRGIEFMANDIVKGLATRYSNEDITDFAKELTEKLSNVLTLDLFEKIDKEHWLKLPQETKNILIGKMAAGTVKQLVKGKNEKIFVIDSVRLELFYMKDSRSATVLRKKTKRLGSEYLSRIRKAELEKQLSSFGKIE